MVMAPAPAAPPSTASAPRSTAQAPRRSWPKPIWTMIVLKRFLAAYRQYLRTGVTPPGGMDDMRRLFRLTNGRFNDLFGRCSAIAHPPRPIRNPHGVFFDSTETSSFSAALRDLRENGFFRPANRLDEGTCNRLLTLGLTAPSRAYPAPGDAAPAPYNRARATAPQYHVDEQAMMEHPDVQRLATDQSILALAQSYLGCEPALVSCCMWWNTNILRAASSEAAQLYHFDMSQIKFVKVFVYLTDVTPGHGAHCYVRASHRRLPKSFLADRRFSDDEVERQFGRDRVVTLLGPAGTMFIEDTRGLHKGLPPIDGDRLLFQLLYANSCFGEPFNRIRLNDRFSGDFLQAVREFRHTYSRFDRT